MRYAPGWRWHRSVVQTCSGGRISRRHGRTVGGIFWWQRWWRLWWRHVETRTGRPVLFYVWEATTEPMGRTGFADWQSVGFDSTTMGRELPVHLADLLHATNVFDKVHNVPLSFGLRHFLIINSNIL